MHLRQGLLELGDQFLRFSGTGFEDIANYIHESVLSAAAEPPLVPRIVTLTAGGRAKLSSATLPSSTIRLQE
jgi:hypothetical protein